MRCMCCNKPFTPAKYHKVDGTIEFEKYCKRCVYIPYNGYQYSDDHEYQHNLFDISIATDYEGNFQDNYDSN